MRGHVGALLAMVLAAFAPPEAAAHGGQYRSPAAPPDDGDPETRFPRASSPDWTDWWWANRDRYLDLARRLRRGDRAVDPTEAGGLGAVAGGGAPSPAGPPAKDPLLFREKVVLPAVTRALADPDSEVRSAAAVALGKMGFRRSFVDLQGALRDPHPDVRDGAVLALGMIRDDLALEQLRALLRDPAERERSRAFAALALGMLGGDRASAELLSFLSPSADAERVGGLQRTTDLRACAVLALGHARSATAIPELRRLYAIAGLLETTPRCCAAISLARLGDRESVPLLLKGIRHREAPMRQCAALALGAVGAAGDAEASALERAAREDEDGTTRQFSIMALGRAGGPAAVASLRRLLLEEVPGPDRPFLALALGVARDRPSAPLLRRRLREEREPGERGAIVVALGLMEDRESAPEIRDLAFGKGPSSLRGHALTALGLLGDAGAAGPARRVLFDEENPGLRLSAALCLGLLRDPEAVPGLALLAREGGSVHVRAHSCYFLGLVGDEEASRVLVRIVEDPLEKMVVRMHAVAGLGALADREPLPVLSGLAADGNYCLAIDPMGEIATFL